MSGIFLFTLASIVGLAATLTVAVYRTLVSSGDKAKFDEALALIQSSEIAELDAPTLADDDGEKKGLGWNRFWYGLALQAGRTPSDSGTPGRYAAGAGIIGAVFGFFVFPGGPVGVVMGLAFIGLGYAWMKFEIGKRTKALDRQMPMLLSALRAQMHAGVTIQAALMSVADDIPSPLGDEIRQVRQNINVSIPLEQALEALSARVSSRQMQFLVSSIGIAVRSGSDIVPQLVTIEEISRQRARIDGKIKAAVALAKPTSYLAIGAPALLFLWNAFSTPEYLAYFLGDGLIIGIATLVLYLFGIFLIRLFIKNVEKT